MRPNPRELFQDEESMKADEPDGYTLEGKIDQNISELMELFGGPIMELAARFAHLDTRADLHHYRQRTNRRDIEKLQAVYGALNNRVKALELGHVGFIPDEEEGDLETRVGRLEQWKNERGETVKVIVVG